MITYNFIVEISKDELFKEIDLEGIQKANPNWYNWIILGQYFYNLLKNFSDSYDYSGCVIYWCKCIEDMSKKLLFDNIEEKVLADSRKYRNLKDKLDSRKKDFTLLHSCYVGICHWLAEKHRFDIRCQTVDEIVFIT